MQLLPSESSAPRKTGIVLAVLFLGAASLLFSLSGRSSAPRPSVPDPTPVRADLSGIYSCLPQNDGISPDEEPCTYGLLADDGRYYVLDFGLMSSTAPPIMPGDRVRGSGVMTPILMLSSDHWQKYPIEGIFSVTDSLEVSLGGGL